MHVHAHAIAQSQCDACCAYKDLLIVISSWQSPLAKRKV